MPYDVTGYDSAGVLHAYVLADDGTVSGDQALLVDWLAEHPVPEPGEDVPLAEPGEPPSPEMLELLRQHYSKLLTSVQISQHPAPPPEPPVEPPVEPPADMQRLPYVPPGA